MRARAPLPGFCYTGGMCRQGSQTELENKRLLAANMFEQSLETHQIVAILGVDDQSVRRWHRTYRTSGREGLLSKRHPGRKPRLDPGQKQRLAELLLQTPAECGFDKNLWTAQLIADLIQREFGVSYHHDHVGTILHEMGFTHQKPARRARERDEARIAHWRMEVWPALLKKAPSPTASS
jgi:transposase